MLRPQRSEPQGRGTSWPVRPRIASLRRVAPVYEAKMAPCRPPAPCLFVVRALPDDLPHVVVTHLRVVLVSMPLYLLDKPFVVVGRKVDVFVCLVSAVESAHSVLLSLVWPGNATTALRNVSRIAIAPLDAAKVFVVDYVRGYRLEN